jgi:hypothetical protein
MQNCNNTINITLEKAIQCLNYLNNEIQALQQQTESNSERLDIKDTVGWITTGYAVIGLGLTIYAWKKGYDARNYAEESRQRIETLECRLRSIPNEQNITQESLNAENLLGKQEKKLPPTTDEEKESPKQKSKNKKYKSGQKEMELGVL